MLATEAKIDETEIQSFRLTRLRQRLEEAELAAIVITDPINLRYATGCRNMQVWTMHNFCRYCFLPTQGPIVLFDLPSSSHLSHGIGTIDEVRPSLAFDYMMVGPRAEEMARRWAAELADLTRQVGGGNRRLALDRVDWLGGQALVREGIQVCDGKLVTERARAIKSAAEIQALHASQQACDAAVAAMRATMKPEMRESEAFASLLQASIALGGEYPETRLLTAGPRTNPWFQEAGDRKMQAGELISFDTDLIGPMGFYNDISRSWVIGEEKPSDEQRRLYDLSRQQLEHNIALLRPGIGFLEYAEKAFKLPEVYLAQRYADVAHGCGLGVEYPLIWYPEDAEWGAYDGVFEENMVVCVESYIGAENGREGVKLEQPVWLSSGGPVVLSDYPLEDDFS